MKIDSTIIRCLSIVALTSLCGCTYQTVAVGPSGVGMDINADNFRNAHASYFLNLDDKFQHIESKRIGSTCSSHKYPIDVTGAISQTIEEIFATSFSSHDRYDSPILQADLENSYVFEFEVESFDFQLGYAAGTWTGSAHAEASMTLQFTVLESDGTELLTSTVSGDGSAIRSGGCGQGSAVLGESASEAIEESFQIFVYQVLDSDVLDTVSEEVAEASVANTQED